MKNNKCACVVCTMTNKWHTLFINSILSLSTGHLKQIKLVLIIEYIIINYMSDLINCYFL